MPPRNGLRAPQVIIRRPVEPPTEGALAEALISNPQGLLDATLPAVSLPESVREETERATTAAAKGSRYAYRGEIPVRITVDLPKGLHKALRIRCAEEGIDARAIVIRALAAMGIVEP